jgi:hypothetical protein
MYVTSVTSYDVVSLAGMKQRQRNYISGLALATRIAINTKYNTLIPKYTSKVKNCVKLEGTHLERVAGMFKKMMSVDIY